MTPKITAILIVLALLCTPALAVNQGSGTTLGQAIHFRSGPGTEFTELYTIPAGTEVVAIEKETGSDAVWVLCDFEYEGNRARGYAELDDLGLNESIAWADHERLSRTLVLDADAYAAPDDTTRKRASFPAGGAVTFLGFEGSFCLVEYQKGAQSERGYINEFCFWVDLGEFAEWFPEDEYDSWYVVRTPAYVYESFSGDEQPLYSIPYDRSVIVDFSADLPDDWISIYYAGQWKFGHRGDFNDLRGYVEPDY